MSAACLAHSCDETSGLTTLVFGVAHDGPRLAPTQPGGAVDGPDDVGQVRREDGHFIPGRYDLIYNVNVPSPCERYVRV